MRKIIIDGNEIDSRETLFASLKKQIGSETFQGNNLDALYDALTESDEPLEVEIREADALRAALGEYAVKLMRALYDAAEEM